MKPTAPEAMAEMIRSGVIYVSGYNTKGNGLYWLCGEPVPPTA